MALEQRVIRLEGAYEQVDSRLDDSSQSNGGLRKEMNDGNRHRREPYEDRIYVIRTEDGLVVKRLRRDELGRWEARSDNPDWKAVLMNYGAEIIGEVQGIRTSGPFRDWGRWRHVFSCNTHCPA